MIRWISVSNYIHLEKCLIFNIYLGYTDPGKDLRKAVKAKEKAAKKAKKEKKRKGIKEEDLFDPKNLEKYRKELEEKKKFAGWNIF